MTMRKYGLILIALFATVSLCCAQEVAVKQALSQLPNALEIQSPSGNFKLTFSVKDDMPVYSVAYRGKLIIAESRLGLEQEGVNLGGLAITGQQTSSHDETWKPVYGERNAIRDHYNQVAVNLGKLQLTFRAYDEGVAFCYTIPKQPGLEKVVITKEQSEFRFLGDHSIWETYKAQGEYTQTTLSKINKGSSNYHKGCERPLVAQAANDLFIAVGEAKLVDYARMKFAPLAGATHSLVSVLSGPVTAALPLTTPWRVVMSAESPGRLLENNDIFLNLNEPCALTDTSWIKPGKVLRVMAMSTPAAKATIDTAVQLRLQYILFDAGWYGEERDPASDASEVAVKLRKQLDLQDVIRYGEARGIGVILYVNRRALEKQLDEILTLYQKWGVKGVKYGFVNVGPQEWTSWLHDAIRKAADHKLMIDVHDEYRPTGYSRTYPNLMTVEGVMGDETKPTNKQTLTSMFMRSLAGPADNTFLYYKDYLTENATHAYQLAKTVCLFSPWQFLFWYDRPENIGDEPELEFFKLLPTSWDDTKVIHGQIGEYAVIARRSGAEWFIGAMNSDQDRTLDVPLTFLEPGRKYTAHIYSDDPNVQTRTHVRIERRPVEASTDLQVLLSAKGGQAIRIEPATADKAEAPGSAAINNSDITAPVETDKQMQSEGPGWRLQRAAITDPTRPRVLMVGDSILNGYMNNVTKALDGKVYVDLWVTPHWHSARFNKMFAEVLACGPYDVVHINLGLHGYPKGRIPEGQYEPLTRALVEVVRQSYPKTKMIWANTTPIMVKDPEKKERELDPVLNPIIVEQNRLAAKVMGEMNVPVNDFYALVVGKLNLSRGPHDPFHWSAPAYKILGDAAAQSIMRFAQTPLNHEPTNDAEAQAQNMYLDKITPDEYQKWVAFRDAQEPEKREWLRTLESQLGPFYGPPYMKAISNNRVKLESDPWAYVKDDSKLPRVLIIGDSISRAYTASVREALKGKANVHRAPANCGPTDKFLQSGEAWLEQNGNNKWDVITVNFGIHDRGKKPEQYSANLKKIIARLRETGAKILWVRTTPFGPIDESAKVNETADRVAMEEGLEIIDLHDLIAAEASALHAKDNIHFIDEGAERLAKLMTTAIEVVLQ
jgi:alpha-glucosidase